MKEPRLDMDEIMHARHELEWGLVPDAPRRGMLFDGQSLDVCEQIFFCGSFEW